MSLAIKAKLRKTVGAQNNEVRRQGSLPAVVYGHGFNNENLVVEYNPIAKVYKEAGYSSLIDLEIENNKPVKVLIQDIAKHPVTDRIIHVDFHQVSMSEKLEARVSLKFMGEAPAVKELGGVLVKKISQIKVRCLPADLVHELEIDLTSLKTLSDNIYIKDIKLPKGMEVLDKPNEVVAKVTEVAEEEVASTITEAEAIAKVEVEKKKVEEEGEEGAEGKPAAGKPAPAGKAEGKKEEKKAAK